MSDEITTPTRYADSDTGADRSSDTPTNTPSLTNSAALIGEPDRTASSPACELLLDVPLAVTVEVGRISLPVRKVMALQPGDVVELDRLATDLADVYANGRKIAQGEVVVVGETLGIRITQLVAGERSS